METFIQFSEAVTLCAMGFFPLFVAYQALRYKRTYWAVPTISGYRTRKEAVSKKGYALLIGVSSLIVGTVTGTVVIAYLVRLFGE